MSAGKDKGAALAAPAPPPQTNSVALALIDGPETLEPSPEPIIENICEIGACEGVKPVEGSLPALFNDFSSPIITERGDSIGHVGLRTEARAHASPSRREVGDEAHVEQMPEKETPSSPETKERSILTSSLSFAGDEQNIERSNSETTATCCPCDPDNVSKNENIRPRQNHVNWSDEDQHAWCQPSSLVSHGVIGRTTQIGLNDAEGNLLPRNRVIAS